VDDSYESTLVLKIKADFWAHVMTFQRNEYLTSTWSKSTIPYRYIQYNLCLNLPITHWDMKKNLSGCFFWTHCIMIKIKHRSTLDSLLCSPTTRVACHCVQHVSSNRSRHVMKFHVVQSHVLHSQSAPDTDISKRIAWLFARPAKCI